MNKIISSADERLTYIFDLDGVVYRGVTPQPYAVESINELGRLGHSVWYFTNNAAQTRASYVEKLAGMGIAADEDRVMTSAYATGLYMSDNYSLEGKSVLCVGHEGITDEMQRLGLECGTGSELKRYDFVVAGIKRDITYNEIWAAMYAIRNGAVFIATNTDKTFPLDKGMLAPGGGVIVNAISTATDVIPYVCGKPNTFAIDRIMAISGSDREHTVMVGDRLDTDIAVANNASITSALVMGGVTSKEAALAAEGKEKPDHIIDDLRGLLPS